MLVMVVVMMTMDDMTVIMVMTMMVDTTMAGKRSVHPVEIRPSGQTLTK